MRRAVTDKMCLDPADKSPARLITTGCAGRTVQLGCPRCAATWFYWASGGRTAYALAKEWLPRGGGAPYECDCIRTGRPAAARI